MPKATKKPVTIDFFPINDELFLDESPIRQWVESFGDKFEDHFTTSHDPFELQVKTLEGTSYDVSSADVIIRGVKGEYYPCKKDIFDATYDVNQE